MGANSKIEWTHNTFNPWWGCVKVSPGCAHCYADTFSKRVGLKVWGQDAPRRFFGDKHWNEPRKWDKDASQTGERQRVFCGSMMDVCEAREDLTEHRLRLRALIEETPNLDWLLLTKRPENYLTLFSAWGGSWPLNVWSGCTVENQKMADERGPLLREVPARIRFFSYEPALEAIDFRGLSGIHWVIVGGESGPGSRPFNIEWARRIIRQCKDAGVACFVKQLGAVPVIESATPGRGYATIAEQHEMDRQWPEGTRFGNRTGISELNGQVALLKDHKGGDWSEWPEDLRIRQFPTV